MSCHDPDRFGFVNPLSSDPIAIYRQFEHDIAAHDTHSDAIDRNRTGVKRGAASMCDRGIIDHVTRVLIEATVDGAALADFKPLLIVIPFHSVRGSVIHAPIRETGRGPPRTNC